MIIATPKFGTLTTKNNKFIATLIPQLSQGICFDLLPRVIAGD
jgi:hypothetical protein